MSSCAGWQTRGFTFALVLLYRDSNCLLLHSMSSHFSDHGFPGRQALDCTSIVLWPANSTLTSTIYKFITGLTSYCLLYYSLPIMPSSVVHIFHWKFLRHTILRSGPNVYCGTIFTPFVRFPYLSISSNFFRGSSGWRVKEISNS